MEPTSLCAVWPEYRNYCVKVSVLLSCPFPHPLARKSRLLFSLLFWFVPIGFSKLPISPTSSLEYVRPKKMQGFLTTQCTGSHGHRPVSLLLSTFQCLPMSVFYVMSRVFRCTWQKAEGKGLQLHFSKSKSQHLSFDTISKTRGNIFTTLFR